MHLFEMKEALRMPRLVALLRHGMALGFLALVTGCGGIPDAPMPTATEAKSALQTTLDAWKDGKPPTSLASGDPAIEPVDFEWRTGKKLTDYAIGEESAEGGTKVFSTKITLGPKESKDVKYMVVGKQPIRVFRDEDYQRMVNMENGPAVPKKGR